MGNLKGSSVVSREAGCLTENNLLTPLLLRPVSELKVTVVACACALCVDYTQNYLVGEVAALPLQYIPPIFADRHVCTSKRTQLMHFLLTCTLNNSLVAFLGANTVQRGRSSLCHSAIIFLSSLIE